MAGPAVFETPRTHAALRCSFSHYVLERVCYYRAMEWLAVAGALAALLAADGFVGAGVSTCGCSRNGGKESCPLLLLSTLGHGAYVYGV